MTGRRRRSDRSGRVPLFSPGRIEELTVPGPRTDAGAAKHRKEMRWNGVRWGFGFRKGLERHYPDVR